jgi:predicted DNA binding CopG/RHH family protein
MRAIKPYKRKDSETMALRKEDLDADDEQRDNAKKRSRITIDLSPDLRRRIKMAALQNDLPIGEYVGRILDQNVPTEVNTSQQRKPMTREAIEGLRQIREQIMQERNGKLFEDSAEMIRQMREERSQELEQL